MAIDVGAFQAQFELGIFIITYFPLAILYNGRKMLLILKPSRLNLNRYSKQFKAYSFNLKLLLLPKKLRLKALNILAPVHRTGNR